MSKKSRSWPGLKLGKRPARKNAIKLKFSALADAAVLPKPPLHFGHEKLLGEDWGVLGNDRFGNCVLAGAAHETMLWTRIGDAPDCLFTEDGVLADYSAITGFDPLKPDTDQGTDMQEAASYRRKIGVVDVLGNRHKVAAYLEIDPGDLKAHYQALWLFGAVGIGFEFPTSAWEQFDASKPWKVVKGSRVDGGHYVPLVSKRRTLECITWGRSQGMTVDFFHHYNDESVVYVSEDSLIERKSPEGFDYDTLVKFLNGLPPA